MADKPGKYAAALAAISESPPTAPTVLLPTKPAVPRGKRITAGWKQKAVLLQEASVEEALQRLKSCGDRTDFSDLMQALLEAWIRAPERD